MYQVRLVDPVGPLDQVLLFLLPHLYFQFFLQVPEDQFLHRDHLHQEALLAQQDLVVLVVQDLLGVQVLQVQFLLSHLAVL